MNNATKLDANQVIKNVFDETLSVLKVKGEFDDVIATFTEATADALGDIADPMVTNPSVNATVISLLKGILNQVGGGGGGDATAANQLTQINKLNEIKDILSDIFDEIEKNTRTRILEATDRVQTITYADFGNKNQRVTQIDYNSPNLGTIIARKTINYTLVGNSYRRDSIVWSLV